MTNIGVYMLIMNWGLHTSIKNNEPKYIISPINASIYAFSNLSSVIFCTPWEAGIVP